jgi:hypothetical protein
MRLRPDAKLGSTEIFVSADRYYPSGFRVEIGTGLVMALKPGDKQLTIVKSADESDANQAQAIRWDHENLHLIIDKWAVGITKVKLKIIPLGS